MFCNKSCSAKYNNKKYPKRKKETTVLAKCLECACSFYYNPLSSYGKFCSISCCTDYKYKNKSIPKIEQGLVTNSTSLKLYLTKKKGYVCEICKLVDWENKPISLHVDHIDGNSDNNLPTNIRLLCPNCHSQTSTYCGRNTKNTKRSSYNKRYRLKKLVGTDGNAPTTPECKPGVILFN